MSEPLRVLFVCAMNKRRSVTAERLYRNDARLQVRSAGLRSEAPRRVTEGDLQWADIVYVMEREHASTIKQRFGALELPPIEVLDVPDDFACMDPQLQEILRLTLDPDLAARIAAHFMNPTEQAIHALHSTWIDRVNAGDLERLLTLITDDVVFISPGQDPSGRDGFSAVFSAACQEMRFRCVSELEEVVVVGDVAYTRSRDALSVTPRAGGETTQLAGYRMTVYRQQPDGRWLLARDAHTLAPVGR